MNSNQKQKSGAGSVNIQAQTVHYGISYTEAKDIALTVFRDNFIILSEEAFSVAQARVEAFTEALFLKLAKDRPEALDSARDPDMQRVLFEAQKEIACRDDESLSAMLIEMIVDRTTRGSGSIAQLVLNEALAIAPKLTQAHYSVLSLVLYVTQCNAGIARFNASDQDLRALLQEDLAPLGSISLARIDVSHLMYTGCLSKGFSNMSVGDALRNRYLGLFSNGISPHAIEDKFLCAYVKHSIRPNFFILPVTYADDIPDYLNGLGISDRNGSVKAMMSASRWSADEIEDFLAEGSAQTRGIFETWNMFKLGKMELTSVGIALAHANLRIIGGLAAGLDTWIR